MLAERGEIPAIIIVTVSIAGVILLGLNAVLLYCFVRHRRGGGGLDGLSQGGSHRPLEHLGGGATNNLPLLWSIY